MPQVVRMLIMHFRMLKTPYLGVGHDFGCPWLNVNKTYFFQPKKWITEMIQWIWLIDCDKKELPCWISHPQILIFHCENSVPYISLHFPVVISCHDTQVLLLFFLRIRTTPHQGPISQRFAINCKFSWYTFSHWATIDINCTINHKPLWNGIQDDSLP